MSKLILFPFRHYLFNRSNAKLYIQQLLVKATSSLTQTASQLFNGRRGLGYVHNAIG